jgi:hypothetical protein
MAIKAARDKGSERQESGFRAFEAWTIWGLA